MKPLRPIVPLTLLMAVSPVAQQGAPPPAAQGQEQPRFRGGANLVRLDAYVTVGGEPVTDLTAQDFEVLEDNVPQKVESFEHIRPRRPAAQAERLEPNTVSESRTMASDPSARLFVLFLDTFHVPLAGSFHARKPLVQFLDRAIGQDDMVGMMTAEMSARNLTLARRTETIEGILTDNWYWGKRDRIATKTEREQALEMCYPDLGATAGIAEQGFLQKNVVKGAHGEQIEKRQLMTVHGDREKTVKSDERNKVEGDRIERVGGKAVTLVFAGRKEKVDGKERVRIGDPDAEVPDVIRTLLINGSRETHIGDHTPPRDWKIHEVQLEIEGQALEP